jgi:membrane protease YdiL (CAAX protease family)
VASAFINKIVFSDKGLRLVWVIAVLALLITIGEVVIVDPLGALLEIFGLSDFKGTMARSWATSLHDVAKRIARITVILLSTYLVLRLFMRRSLNYIGLRTDARSMKDLMLGIGFALVIELTSVLLMRLVGWYEVVGFTWQFNPAAMLGPAFLFVLVLAIETGIIEEVFFRGLLITTVADRSKLGTAVVFSSILFGLMHFSGATEDFPWWASITSATIAGFMFAQAFLLCRSLWLPLGIHLGWHLWARILGSVGVTPDEALCLVTEVKGPGLLVNTKAGGAGGVELVGVGIVSLILWQMSKRSRKRPPSQ